MEDSILKFAEFGIVGVFSLLLLTKGLTCLIELTKTTAQLYESQKALAESIGKLADKIADMGIRLGNFGFQLDSINKHLEKMDECSARNFAELKDLIKEAKS